MLKFLLIILLSTNVGSVVYLAIDLCITFYNSLDFIMSSWLIDNLIVLLIYLVSMALLSIVNVWRVL